MSAKKPFVLQVVTIVLLLLASLFSVSAVFLIGFDFLLFFIPSIIAFIWILCITIFGNITNRFPYLVSLITSIFLINPLTILMTTITGFTGAPFIIIFAVGLLILFLAAFSINTVSYIWYQKKVIKKSINLGDIMKINSVYFLVSLIFGLIGIGFLLMGSSSHIFY